MGFSPIWNAKQTGESTLHNRLGEMPANVTAMLNGALRVEPHVNYLYENVAVRQRGQDGKWLV